MKTLWTIGHSTRTFDEFVHVLRTHGIEQIIDIRSVPRSHYNPQFNKDALGPALRSRKIGYRHMAALGGLRHVQKGSANTGWRNASFRGYADYMQTPEFRKGIAALIGIARRKKTAIMCAEAVPWRCHRSLVGDWMVLMEKWKVSNIFSESATRPHAPTDFARMRRGTLVYPE